MLIGVPGSGKSTLSQDIIKENPQVKLLSSDIYIEEKAAQEGKTYGQMYRELNEAAVKWLNIAIKQCMNKKESFIWDQTNTVATARSRKVRTLLQNKYEVIGIALSLPEEELYKRLNKRKEEGGKHIPFKIIQSQMSEYTLPNYEEGFDQIYIVNENNEYTLLPKKESMENTKIKI